MFTTLDQMRTEKSITFRNEGEKTVLLSLTENFYFILQIATFLLALCTYKTIIDKDGIFSGNTDNSTIALCRILHF